jgi:hypothetical protein
MPSSRCCVAVEHARDARQIAASSAHGVEVGSRART